MNYTLIEVKAKPRYWEDAIVNGERDVDGTRIPLRKGDLWYPMIRLDDGQIQGWPTGTSANIYYKVCDEGEYWLLDDKMRRVAKWEDPYVPDSFLCHGGEGFGDYLILNINEEGFVIGWKAPKVFTPKDWDFLDPSAPLTSLP